MPPRDLPHLFLHDRGEKERYTARGGGGSERPPQRDRAVHAGKLASDLASAIATSRGDLLQRDPSAAPLPGPPGLYLEFALEAGRGTGEVLKSLEARAQGIELVAVRAPVSESPGETIATVFVPEAKVGHFEKRIEDYRTKDSRWGRPKHEALVASITAVRSATPRSVFTGRPEEFPTDEVSDSWWELWIRDGYGAQIESAAERLEILLRPHVVHFVERDVRVARASVAQLARLMAQSDGVAELRIAKDTPAFFMRESNVAQAEWAEEMLSRVVSGNGAAGPEVAVCILDGGVNRGHPLLTPHIAAADVLSVEPAWGGADDAPASHAGHGTGMAGLSLYGDLTHAHASSGTIQVPFVVESVKILPPLGVNDPDLYGQITLEAISRAEVQSPHRHRIVCGAVTAEDSGQGGRPSAWSAAIDRAAFDAFGTSRLIVISAGNIRDLDITWAGDYLERNDTQEVESPAQAWNALSVGAYTDKVSLTDPLAAGYRPLAPAGDLCPSSRTALLWSSQWPVKPDVVLEGGNYGQNGGPTIDPLDDLQLLTTYHRISERHFNTFGDTSAATALAANLAARVAAVRPRMWPETVRALVVHSAEWTPAMRARVATVTPAMRKRVLLRRYGWGVPDLERATRSASNDLTLVVEGEIQPFMLEGSKVKTKEMAIHRLPWPKDVLAELGSVDVELRMTLSYFVEPNPGERGWTGRYRYASHGLRFDVKRPLESDSDFRRRLSAAVEADDGGVVLPSAGSEGWVLGPNSRNVGSVHSDVWRGSAADLASRGAVGVYPVSGWWRELKRHARYDRPARYALVASIRVPEVEVDIYTPVRLSIEVTPTPEISVDIPT